jgi:hypothetical protein
VDEPNDGVPTGVNQSGSIDVDRGEGDQKSGTHFQVLDIENAAL